MNEKIVILSCITLLKRNAWYKMMMICGLTQKCCYFWCAHITDLIQPHNSWYSDILKWFIFTFKHLVWYVFELWVSTPSKTSLLLFSLLYFPVSLPLLFLFLHVKRLLFVRRAGEIRKRRPQTREPCLFYSNFKLQVKYVPNKETRSDEKTESKPTALTSVITFLVHTTGVYL